MGNLRRVIVNLRLMHQAGVTGIFTDHCGFNARAGLSELQSYLLYKLAQDVNADADALVRAFTDRFYGPAAPLARDYLEALERGREAMRDLPSGVTHTSGQNFDDRTFPYLTVTTIARWQRAFDRMEALVQDDPDRLLNVRLLRRELDFAVLWKWFPLRQADPAYFADHAVYADRIRAVNAAPAPGGLQPRPLGESALADFLAVIAGGGREKPLPAEFEGIDPARIVTLLPSYTARLKEGQQRQVLDPDAARGYAITVHYPDMPLQVGFYEWQSRNPSKGVHGPRLSVDKDRITPGVYRFYKLGTVMVTPDCWLWFSAQSWGTHLDVGTRLYEAGADNRWDAWVSLKFDGPAYGGAAAEDRVLCDRIVFVQAAAP